MLSEVKPASCDILDHVSVHHTVLYQERSSTPHGPGMLPTLSKTFPSVE